MLSTFMAAVLAIIAYVSFKRFTRPSLSRIRGPKSSSFILGNLQELFRSPAGDTDFEWQSLYGDVVRFKTIFGEDQLLISDPKALQWIFNTSAYHYPKQQSNRIIAQLINGNGVVSAEGEDHKRQRRILAPGFGVPESKAFLNIFKRCAESVCMKWMEIIGNSTHQTAVINIQPWLSYGTLDAIGQAAFDVQFGVVKDDAHPLATAYKNVVSDIFGRPSAQQIFFQAASNYIPTPILQWIIDHGSHHRLQRARELRRAITVISKELIRDKAGSTLAGKQGRDIFSLLIKANMDSEAKDKLTEDELFAQMRTILFAGHETTSNTLSWLLWEVARRPEVQSRLRDEIRQMEAAIRARGDTQFTIPDFDAMPYTTAVIKEGLRYNPVVPHASRIANRADILPLTRPVTTESGEVINEIAIPKGTGIVASIAAYNRNKDLWGEDAHDFNPDRWIDGVANEKKAVQIGVYSNLMTFLGGARACPGWRFAIIEIQAFLVEIIGRFELTMTERSEKVRRGFPTLMPPVIEGELDRGAQLPLAVSIVAQQDDP